MTRNLLLKICFDGTAYHGWQIQKNALSVQEVFQNALYKILPDCPDIKGCSRTDSGVHAREYCVSVKTESSISCNKIPAAINSFLPKDIAVLSCSEVPDDFHARYSTTAKEYEYVIYNGSQRNPFYEGYSLHCRQKMQLEILNKAASFYVGKHDFKAFCSSHSDKEDTVRQVFYANISQTNDIVTFKVCANGFLYNMVRIMAGTLLFVNAGKINCKDIPYIIKSKQRSRAGQTAPAQGLYLNKIFYSNKFENS